LTRISNNTEYDKHKAEHHLFIHGWIEYFQVADMQSYQKHTAE